MKRVLLTAAFTALALAASASATPPDEETEHIVKPGETLNGIANRAGVSRELIIDANHLEPPFVIRIGQKLAIPRKPAGAAPGREPVASPTSIHVVEAGETLGGIANRAKVPRVLIAEANGLAPPYVLQVGQKLVIPRTQRHTVGTGETGFAIAYRFGVPWDNIAVANGIDPDAPIRPGQTLLIPTVLDVVDPAPAAAVPVAAASSATSRFTWPLRGEVRRGFRPRGQSDYHDGVDIVAPRGSAVRAAAAGEVIFAGPEDQQFGNLVVVDHGDGWHSAYGSLGRVTVKKGHKVTKGERVGLVGDTSVTRRTELHFELRQDGKPVDPLMELPESP